MSELSKKHLLAAFMAGFAMSAVFFTYFGVPKHQAIAHGAAHYDAVTGEFKWNDEKR